MAEHFTDQQAQQILRLAAEKFAFDEARKHGLIKQEQLVEMAREMGVPEKYVTDAIAETQATQQIGDTSEGPTTFAGNPPREQWVRFVPGKVNAETWQQICGSLRKHFKGKSLDVFDTDRGDWTHEGEGPLVTVSVQNFDGFAKLVFTRTQPRKTQYGVLWAMLVVLSIPLAAISRQWGETTTLVYILAMVSSIPYIIRQIVKSNQLATSTELILDHLECLIRRGA